MDTEIQKLEKEVEQLRKLLSSKENELLTLKEKNKVPSVDKNITSHVPRWAIERYSRQSLLSELGSPKDSLSKLMTSSVLIVGCGGLGSPAAIYLAGSGIGHIGIVDYDEVELNNIHRQPLHSELTLGMTKVESAAMTLRRLNSNIIITPHNLLLNSENALSIIEKYDVVLDATDNAVTRYLLNDACVLSKKPLVSAAALQLSGQLAVYNHTILTSNGEKNENGPCYRCIFPNPPPPEMMGSCSQNGVLGPVPGVMGCLQAIETIKVILGKPSLAGHLLLYDGSDCSFRKVKLRPRSKNCSVCSDSPTITKLIDYEEFCKSMPSDKFLKLNILPPENRITAVDFNNSAYRKILGGRNPDSPILIDVRTAGEYDMCRIEHSINKPIDAIDYSSLVDDLTESNAREIYFICRRGNDSQIAADALKKSWPSCDGGGPIIKDVEGGLHAWARSVDANFPIY